MHKAFSAVGRRRPSDVFDRQEVHHHLPRDVHRADVDAVDHHVGGGLMPLWEGGGGHAHAARRTGE